MSTPDAAPSPSGLRAYFKRQNIEFSWNRIGIQALGGMAHGLFASLLIGTILGTLGLFLPGAAGARRGRMLARFAVEKGETRGGGTARPPRTRRKKRVFSAKRQAVWFETQHVSNGTCSKSFVKFVSHAPAVGKRPAYRLT